MDEEKSLEPRKKGRPKIRPSVDPAKIYDMNLTEVNMLKSYVDRGLPGFNRVTRDDMLSWFSLYISGKTYTEIAKAAKAKKEVVLYASYKGDWHNKKMSHYDDLYDNLARKVGEVKITNLNTLSTIANALGKYFEKYYTKYLQKGNDKIIKTTDNKLLNQYYKTIEMLNKMIQSNQIESNKNTEQEEEGDFLTIVANSIKDTKSDTSSKNDEIIDVEEVKEEKKEKTKAKNGLSDEEASNLLITLSNMKLDKK